MILEVIGDLNSYMTWIISKHIYICYINFAVIKNLFLLPSISSAIANFITFLNSHWNLFHPYFCYFVFRIIFFYVFSWRSRSSFCPRDDILWHIQCMFAYHFIDLLDLLCKYLSALYNLSTSCAHMVSIILTNSN